MKDFMKRNIKFIVIFFVILLWFLFYQGMSADEMWSYGFAHNIHSGLLPYKDFNMVITPFFPMMMAGFFQLFGDSLLTYHVMEAVFITITFYFLFRLIGQKAWLVLLFLFFPLHVFASAPSYNTFLFCLLVLILYLEDKKINDLIIGLVLGLVFLTKQSVGVCFLGMSIFYFFVNFKKDSFWRIGKRVLGFFIPVIFFVLYLLVFDIGKEFLDLCFFGLFDFGKDNGTIFSFTFVLLVLVLIGEVIYFFKHKQDINIYYLLAFLSIAVPLFDSFHFYYVFLSLFFIFLPRVKLLPKQVVGSVIIILISLTSIYIGRGFLINDPVYPNKIQYFNYRYLDNTALYYTKTMIQYFKENFDKKIVIVAPSAYYFKIVTNTPIDSLDLLNRGNSGINGTNKNIERIKKLDPSSTLFLIDPRDIVDTREKQLDQEIIRYIINHGEKTSKVLYFDVYILKG